MPDLWVPPSVTQELQDHTASYNAQIMQMLETAGPVQTEWNRVLRDKFPDWPMFMVRATENAHAPGLVPGFYHLMVVPQGAPVTFLPISLPDGSFCEPSHQTLMWLESADLQNPMVIREREEAMIRHLEDQEKEKEKLVDEVTEDAEDRWAMATRPSVSMAEGWVNSVDGKRARRDPRRTEE